MNWIFFCLHFVRHHENENRQNVNKKKNLIKKIEKIEGKDIKEASCSNQTQLMAMIFYACRYVFLQKNSYRLLPEDENGLKKS